MALAVEQADRQSAASTTGKSRCGVFQQCVNGVCQLLVGAQKARRALHGVRHLQSACHPSQCRGLLLRRGREIDEDTHQQKDRAVEEAEQHEEKCKALSDAGGEFGGAGGAQSDGQQRPQHPPPSIGKGRIRLNRTSMPLM